MRDYLLTTIISISNLEEFENVSLKDLVGSLEIKLNGKSIEKIFSDHLSEIVNRDRESIIKNKKNMVVELEKIIRDLKESD